MLTLNELLELKGGTPWPRVVCLCGSTRFINEFHEANLKETLAGRIVLSVGAAKSDADLQRAGQLTDEQKVQLDLLHLFKVGLADEILVLDVGGYIGPSTSREIEYARLLGKPIRFLSQEQEG